MIDGEPPTSDEELERAIDAFIAERGAELAGFAGLPPAGSELPLDEGSEGGPAAGFELVRRIGEGGMGIVFEARQRNALGRRVAVKLLRPFTTDAGRERFRREIEAILALDHPGIVPVVAAEVEGDSPFLAMKLVDGVSLTELLTHLRENEAPPARTAPLRAFVLNRTREDVTPPDRAPTDAWNEAYHPWAAQLAVQLCDALQHAHDRGVVHRDVKPGNIVLTPEGRAILLDFGIAATEQDGTLTRTGDFVGTLHYCSPEQTAGKEIDGRADVYSVGATLFELLTLRRPHGSLSPTELLRRGALLEPPQVDRDVPADLRTICRHALAGDRARRYATPAALAADLRAYLIGEPIQARPPRWPTRALRAVRRRPRAAWSLVAAAALALWLGRAELHRSRATARVQAGAPIVAELADLRGRVRDERAALARWSDEKDAVGRLAGSVFSERLAELHRNEARFEERAGAAQRHLDAAFAHVAGFGPARRALAEVHAQRLAAALDANLDLLDPPRLARLEVALAEHDLEGRHAPWLDPTGRVELACDLTGLPLAIYRDGEETPLLSTVTPTTLELEEGSYVAVAAHPAGGTTRLPFLVRRDAVYESDPEALPPRRIPLELLAASERRAGFVHVPAGWTLMGDDPPRWRFVRSFEIQALEVSFGDYLEWLRIARPEPLEDFVPAGTTGPFVLVDETDGSLVLREGIEGRWPVLGLTPDAMHAYAERIEPPRAAEPGARYVDLPDPGEWLRAARGADARRFASGSTFSWSLFGGYYSRPDPEMARPYAVGEFEGDLSPFGVRGMTGSVAELQGEYRWERHGGRAVRGGSYRTRTEAEMELLARRSTEVAEEDVGVRLVRRPVPEWMAEPDRDPEPFFDDFERPDSDVVGNGWHEYGGEPLTPLDPSWTGDLTRIRSGALLCEAETGQFSTAGLACHRVHLGDRFRVRVTLSYEAVHADERRSIGISLAAGFGLNGEVVGLTVSPSGRIRLGSSEGEHVESLSAIAQGAPHVFELDAVAGEWQGRIWPAATSRPGDPLVRIDLPRRGRMRFLVLAGANLVGGQLEVDDVRVEPR